MAITVGGSSGVAGDSTGGSPSIAVGGSIAVGDADLPPITGSIQGLALNSSPAAGEWIVSGSFALWVTTHEALSVTAPDIRIVSGTAIVVDAVQATADVAYPVQMTDGATQVVHYAVSDQIPRPLCDAFTSLTLEVVVMGTTISSPITLGGCD